jgi:nifR3 family TIM-barrel protein
VDVRIGPLRVDPPVVLAPMAGVTNPAFRQLCREFGPALYVSEMITARALVEHNPRTMRMVARAPGEKVHSVQLYGVDPLNVKRAVDVLVNEIGCDHIDMNFGCPAPKVTRRGGGAALPAHPQLLRAIIGAAVGASGPVPVTIKMRIGIDDDTVTFLEAGRIAEGEGARAVALHARTAEQRYAPTARWTAVAELKQAVTSIPVLGNGDIFTPADALAMMDQTGCDGVVVGRGCLGRPWLFAELAAAFAGHEAEPDPPLGWICAVMARHARLLMEYFDSSKALRDFRKHTGWYLTGFPIGPAARQALSQVDTIDQLEEQLQAFDPGITRPAEEAWRPRGHTDGPRPVALPEFWLDQRDDATPPIDAEELVSGG